MRKSCFLGIDTSNYTTSLSFCDEEGRIVANLKCPLPVKPGERGLRQSDAVFLHTKNIPTLFEMAKPYFAEYLPLAIGVSSYPRSVEGSYMPCFLLGRACAVSLGTALDVPVYEFSHQNGHVMAAIYSSGAPKEILDEKFLAFHVSGGTTEIILVTPNDGDFHCELVGGTLDMNAGQAIDRVGVAMGLTFPCGPELERLALVHTEKKAKGIRISVKDGYCNLSGLENKAMELYRNSGDKNLVALFVLDFIAATLAQMTKDVCSRYPGLPIVYAGGVMSCSLIKATLANSNVYFAEPQFSSDNAAGIALLTRKKHKI